MAQVLAGRDGVTWQARAAIEERLHLHEMDLPAAAMESALGGDFAALLSERLLRLGIESAEVSWLLEEATRMPGWRGVSALDAACRHVEARPVVQSVAAVRGTFEAILGADGRLHRVPPETFHVRESARGVTGEERVRVRGAVILECFPL